MGVSRVENIFWDALYEYTSITTHPVCLSCYDTTNLVLKF